jgi:hypothetical protein
MRLLLDYLSETRELPVEIKELISVLVDAGIQDEIYLRPVNTDPGSLRGAIRQFRKHQGVYGEALWVTHIVYSQNSPLEWQRITCAKEIVHLFDKDIEKTDTIEEVMGLIDKLVGPLTTETFGVVDIQATVDRFAVYKCLPLLLPKAALSDAKLSVSRGELSIQEVAEAACMPSELVSIMISDEWDKVIQLLDSLGEDIEPR